MTTYKVNNGTVSFNLPPEGTVFRARGDNHGQNVYKVENGKVVALSSTRKIANTRLQLNNGTTVEAGQEIRGGDPVAVLTPGFTGTWWSNDRQSGLPSGQQWQSLPEYNIADINTVLQRNGGVLPTTDVEEKHDPAIKDHVNPNKDWQESVQLPQTHQNPNMALQTPGTMGTPQTPSAGSSTASPTGAATPSADLEKILASSGLSKDLQDMLRQAYGAIATNDVAAANRMIAGFNAATQFSDPYFKAQIRIATDALTRGISEVEGDLAFKEQQQKNTLDDIRSNTAASKDYLSFQQANELKELERQLGDDLDATADEMASRGLTSSSIRSKKESMLNDRNSTLVESTSRKFGYQTGTLDRALASQERDNSFLVDYYRQLAQNQKLDMTRSTEAQVGSSNLGGFTGTMGGIGGEIPRRQVQDALSFSQQFVF